jgi:hypothetical protein
MSVSNQCNSCGSVFSSRINRNNRCSVSISQARQRELVQIYRPASNKKSLLDDNDPSVNAACFVNTLPSKKQVRASPENYHRKTPSPAELAEANW